jgi:putative peptidoglycan binding protein
MRTSKGQRNAELKTVKTFFILICSLALAWIAGAQTAPEKKEQPKKKGAQTGQVSQPPGHAAGKPATTGKPTATGKPTEVGKPTGVGKAKATGKSAEVGKAAAAGKAKTTAKPTEVNRPAEVGKAAGAGKAKTTAKATEVNKRAEVGKATGAAKATTAGKTTKPQHFNVPKQPNTAKAPPVQFQQGKHIEGSQSWQGSSYTVFRNYTPEWHDEGWWHDHYGSNIVFMFGAPYYLNAGYWFPAWGYNPNAYYAYDGPIYAYNNLPPDQVIANVQSALQQQGYYHGEIDGLLGPETRGAVAAYQRDHGLYETASIDQPTLQSLGMI